ncbi:Fe(3+) ABC transporter substrate-binding protein [Vibrio parahaemolyticus]|jgi:iron(III) transport system substrate-binding protein|uniref:Iron ABC transporter substrate-binding protein n=2 Tax=Vibrio natriegens TaxID=691 RepID=A0AAN1CWD5_VIBNA|nr:MULTISPECIES: Fe(3+) ABC transporter substrate-binding protein [Vibrio]MEE3879418.1 Fe(3+) ABC transporter substrate-binding protein [Vibrio sp. YYF0003]WMN86820.1 Fe(3+) ABC transporter substrate-binding protein [Vibrio parahaemolyticus]CAH0524672.1 Iron uptake protein A1 [Catenococcus thiocycli]AEX23051.1 iron ABC transporter substrate-binding protein [Vibrio sp. EJY3]ALR14705.1 iron ABC transporter substrate-binding protein [Vibrio natriegens NBRC 15636 = ATCC 14048 = DSM 759]
MKKVLTLSALACATLAPTAMAAEEVNVYSYRQPFLVEPMFNEFTKETGIKVNVKFAKTGIAEKLVQEGEYSPADVLLTVDIARLAELTQKGVVQPVDSPVLEKNIPAQYQDSANEWFALTTRTRSVYSSRDRVGKLGKDFTYADLAKPEFKGKICTRSGKHPYNVSLVSSMIAHQGEAATKEWLEGVKANLARKPQGNDRGQVKAIKEGLCDVSLGNSYYLGKMVNDKEQKAWADSVYINFPNQETTGTHVNISGMAMAKYAPNKENALKLMEFLAGDKAQSMYAEVNFEYPVKADVKPSELVASWGEFKADTLSLDEIADHHEAAIKLLDEVKFDL